MINTVLGLAIGFAVGWLLGRRSSPAPAVPVREEKLRYRPSKRQRQILETLEPDPVLPSIEELVIAEATESGVVGIGGADGVPLHVRLKVWKRDHEAVGPCENGHLEFLLRPGAAPEHAEPSDLTLRCVAGGDETEAG